MSMYSLSFVVGVDRNVEFILNNYSVIQPVGLTV
jgi:hypothetical protein